MGQITIYLDDDSEARLRAAAADANMPVSRWLAELVREKTRADWPHAVREAAGTWHDFPDAESLRNTPGDDTRREKL